MVTISTIYHYYHFIIVALKKFQKSICDQRVAPINENVFFFSFCQVPQLVQSKSAGKIIFAWWKARKACQKQVMKVFVWWSDYSFSITKIDFFCRNMLIIVVMQNKEFFYLVLTGNSFDTNFFEVPDMKPALVSST